MCSKVEISLSPTVYVEVHINTPKMFFSGDYRDAQISKSLRPLRLTTALCTTFVATSSPKASDSKELTLLKSKMLTTAAEDSGRLEPFQGESL